MNLYQFFSEGLDDAKKNSPLIFTGLACVGVVATSIISIFAGKKMQQKDEVVKEKIEEMKVSGEEVTPKKVFVEHVKEKWPALAPVAVGVIVTCFCTIKSYKISATRIVGLTTALTATTKAFDGYKKAAEKLLGDKEQEIRREKMKNELAENPMPKALEDKVKTEGANNVDNIYNAVQSWYDEVTNQYVGCTEGDIVRALESCSSRVKFGESFVSYDEFLWELPVKVEHPQIAQTIGWPYERCKHGIEYNLKDGVKAPNGLFVGKIGVKVYTETTEYLIDTINN